MAHIARSIDGSLRVYFRIEASVDASEMAGHYLHMCDLDLEDREEVLKAADRTALRSIMSTVRNSIIIDGDHALTAVDAAGYEGLCVEVAEIFERRFFSATDGA